MNLHTVTKSVTKAKKRLGQGHGSGKVKTGGRGTKGQQARRNIPLFFEGGALPLIKRLPFLRGKGKNYSLQPKPVIVSLSALNTLAKDSVVDIKTLAKKGVIREDEAMRDGIKILGDGKLEVALTVKLPVSKSAQAKIEKAGGKVE